MNDEYFCLQDGVFLLINAIRPALLKNWRKFLGNPLLTLGILLLKTGEGGVECLLECFSPILKAI